MIRISNMRQYVCQNLHLLASIGMGHSHMEMDLSRFTRHKIHILTLDFLLTIKKLFTQVIVLVFPKYIRSQYLNITGINKIDVIKCS